MKAIFTTLLLSHAFLFSEGLNKDENGNLASPHQIVSLNESQIEELETLNSITLTKQQWQATRRTSPNTPKRLEGILPITHNDCTCGEFYSAVLLSDKKLALFIEEQTPDRIAGLLAYKKNLTIRVDKRGQFYLDGILTRFPNLVAALKQSKPAPRKEKESEDWYQIGTASIETPLLLPANSSVYAGRIQQVSKLLQAKGWTVYERA